MNVAFDMSSRGDGTAVASGDVNEGDEEHSGSATSGDEED